MASGKKPQDIRLSVRLTPEERLALQDRAGDVPISAFVRAQLLGKARTSRTTPAPDRHALAQILGLLGETSVFRALSALEKAVQIGALPEDEEIRSTLAAARADLAEIKSLLMHALRTQER